MQPNFGTGPYPHPVEQGAAALFDNWASAGRDLSMADGHRDVTGQLLDGWRLDPRSHVLDVGCGNGWAVRWALDRGAGAGTGVDVSPNMIERALGLRGPGNAHFRVASAASLPFATGAFSHVLSVESLYYSPNPAEALAEWARVAAPGGSLGVIIDLYRENLASHGWIEALGVPVHLLSEAELPGLAREAGWSQAATTRLRDRRAPKPVSEFAPSPYWPSYEAYLAHREAGSLALVASR